MEGGTVINKAASFGQVVQAKQHGPGLPAGAKAST
jgi:hypothetical protein